MNKLPTEDEWAQIMIQRERLLRQNADMHQTIAVLQGRLQLAERALIAAVRGQFPNGLPTDQVVIKE